MNSCGLAITSCRPKAKSLKLKANTKGLVFLPFAFGFRLSAVFMYELQPIHY